MPIRQSLVSVVMATYNGARFLRQQLDSILEQTHRNLEIVVSDDGSTDGTVDILEEYATKSALRWCVSEAQKGPRSNFSNAAKYARGDYVAFADQDDVWKPTKIEASLKALQAIEHRCGHDTPILVFTDVELVDEELLPIADSLYKVLGRNPRLTKLNRLLSGSIALGCSILSNRSLVRAAMPVPDQAGMHDAWFELVACALGRLEFLDHSTVLYRQHERNAVGVRRRSFWDKALRMLTMRSSNTNYRNLVLAPRYARARAVLERFEAILPDETSQLVRAFLACEHQGFLAKRASILSHGFLRHSKLENLELLLRI